MIKKKVAIGALARNCEKNLPDNIRRIEELREHFSESSVFVYENNSTDLTKEILRDWHGKSKDVNILIEDIDETIYKSMTNVGKQYSGSTKVRIQKMCDCRNKLLQLIFGKGEYDLIIFVDIDVAWFSVTGVVSAIENAPEGWNGLFSNCYVSYKCDNNTQIKPRHYDTFAYLDKGRLIKELNVDSINSRKRLSMGSKIFKRINKEGYFKCESAFGGIGIYRAACIKDLAYEIYEPKAWDNSDVSLCEHIYFNSKIEGGKYIAKDLEVCYFYFDVNRLKFYLVKIISVLNGF